MLDKSIPFHTIIMKRPFTKVPTQTSLPTGYNIRTYKLGDEMGWAEIETSVLEFDSVEQALNCHKGYLPKIEELKRRQWFVENQEGVLVATATAWFKESENGRVPVVHALSCRPEYQGKGLGRIVLIKTIKTFCELDNGKDIWLDTQTWSYKAIGLYLSLGFVPMKTEVYNQTKNEYQEALPILRMKMRKELFQKFVDSAI